MTKEGKAELLTKADLVSNYFILEQMKRVPTLKVGIAFILLIPNFLQIITEEKDSTTSESEAKSYRADSYSRWLTIRDALEKFPSRLVLRYRCHFDTQISLFYVLRTEI